jgi:capsular polysaccharide transport system permease protein
LRLGRDGCIDSPLSHDAEQNQAAVLGANLARERRVTSFCALRRRLLCSADAGLRRGGGRVVIVGEYRELNTYLQHWAVQRRVWGALVMREIQTRWGRRNLGFAWLFAEPLVFAFPVLALWSSMRSPNEHGLPLMAFLWSGYLPILLFRHVTGHALYSIRNNAALLYHRAITPLDLVIGRCGLEVVGNLAAIATSFLIFYSLGIIDWPVDLPLMLVGILYMAWWSLTVGLIIAALSERTDLVEHIWLPISYMYLPVSGFFYLAAWLPRQLRDVALTVLPSLHSYEIIRAGLFGNRIETFYDMGYLSYVLAGLTLLGLWLIHTVRQHIELVE